MNVTATWRGRHKTPLRGVQSQIFPSAAKRYFVAEGRLAVTFMSWSFLGPLYNQ